MHCGIQTPQEGTTLEVVTAAGSMPLSA